MSKPVKVRDIELGYVGVGDEIISPNFLKALMIVTDEYDIHEGEESPRKCNKCENTVMLTDNHNLVFAESTVCDSCATEWENKRKLETMKDHWKKICPADFRDTKTDHPEFNLEAYKRVAALPFETSFILLGSTGSCKTRIAIHRAKMALLAGRTVRIAFPEDLKDIPRFTSRKEHIAELSKPDLLVMDDAFIAGASKEQVSDFLKDLIDRRIRDKKATIITSQVNSEEYKKDSNKFHNATDVDGKRLDAIARRVKERYTEIDCEGITHDSKEPQKMEF